MGGMKYVSAYLLCSLSGEEVTAEKMEKVLKSVGSEVDSKMVQMVLTKMEGQAVESVIAAGKKTLQAGGGGGVAVAGGAAPVGGAAAGEAKKEAAPVEEEEEEEEVDFDLFG